MDEGSAAALSSMMNSAAQNISAAGYGIAGAKMSTWDRKAQERWMKMQRNWQLEDWNRNVDYQRELWKQSVDYDMAEWSRRFNETNRQNEAFYENYNSPSAQMRAYRQAGINPYYALSKMQGNSIDAATVGAPGVSPGSAPSMRESFTLPPNHSVFQPNFGADPSTFMDSLIRSEQLGMLQEQTKSQRLANLEHLGSIAYNLENANLDAEERRKRKPYIERFIEQELRSANAQEKNTIANTALAYQQSNSLIENITLQKRQFDLQKELQAFNIGKSKRLNDATIWKVSHEVANLDALAGMYGAQSGLLKAQTGTEYANTIFMALRAQGQNLDNKEKDALRPWLIRHHKVMVESEEYNKPNWWTKYGQPAMSPLMNGLGIGAGLWLGLRGAKGTSTVVKPTTLYQNAPYNPLNPPNIFAP